MAKKSKLIRQQHSKAYHYSGPNHHNPTDWGITAENIRRNSKSTSSNSGSRDAHLRAIQKLLDDKDKD